MYAMKLICAGTMITLLYQARSRKGDKVRDICRGVFSAYDCDIDEYSDGLPSHLKSGHDPAPGALIDNARDMLLAEAKDNFRDFVLCNIADGKHKALARAIRAVLRDDPVSADCVLGYPGYEKSNILEHSMFDEAALLASVFKYALTATDNTACKAEIREIPTNFVDSFIESDEEINFIHPIMEQDDFVPVKRTIKDPMFDRIFKKGAELTIDGLTNPSTASIYYIDPVSCKFRFGQMKDFIVTNIGNYVFSRASAERLIDRTKNPAAVGAHAMLKFANKYGSEAETVLGEILLYVFLEQALDAPKIMSKIEISEFRGDYVSKSDGIHLYTGCVSGTLFHQIVFGASDIDGNLFCAIDRAFDKVLEIDEHGDSELRLIYNASQATIFDKGSTDYMRKLMLPQRDGSYKPDMAFGAFLGYTVKLEHPETDNAKYRAALKEQLQKDIAAAKSYLAEKIKAHNMSGYSFYLYVLPFNDAENEKANIIKELLEGGF
jgi:hypothetical protein